MSLAKTLAKGPKPTQYRTNGTDAWLETLPETDRDMVRAAAADPEWNSKQLWRVLKEHGYPMSVSAFRAWRAREPS